jgi:hypothetical protein
MKKIFLILSLLFIGIGSFAGQSIQNEKTPAICTVMVYVGNIRMQMSAANCNTAVNAAQTQQINLGQPVIDGGSFSPFQPSGSFPGSDFILP